MEKHILVKIETILEEESWRDPKSYVQELAQKIDGVTPIYRTLKEEGPDHNKSFTVEAYIGDLLYGEGTGRTKKAAEQEAAYHAILKLHEKNIK